MIRETEETEEREVFLDDLAQKKTMVTAVKEVFPVKLVQKVIKATEERGGRGLKGQLKESHITSFATNNILRYVMENSSNIVSTDQAEVTVEKIDYLCAVTTSV